MMKATAWFCPVLLTLLSATRLVCTAQRGVAAATGAGGGATAAGAGYANGYPLDYLDSPAIQDEFSFVKRNKPSLSIVNPLDVLRQRLLLEIARRQMKENTRQVELNRAILKNVGKRVFLQPSTWANSRYRQQQEEERPSSRFFDFLQRPEAQGKEQPTSQQLLDDANKSLNTGALGFSLGGSGGGGGGVVKHQQPGGNEIAHETNHENGSRKALPLGKSATGDVDNVDNDGEDQDDMLDDLKYNWANEQSDDMDIPIFANNANARLPWHLIYRMHKNPHYAN
ncbi:uncharacterized protein LOC117792236 [Drosophila innubila]|uniref:uncharacterized protein LOC117792236 n=1 Tax=Drosophila innubila TaxID=198719 RepID=UPI00148D89B4|nr:uncharacterized protein LOC117792236 [Drosophila innubila]